MTDFWIDDWPRYHEARAKLEEATLLALEQMSAHEILTFVGNTIDQQNEIEPNDAFPTEYEAS